MENTTLCFDETCNEAKDGKQEKGQFGLGVLERVCGGNNRGNVAIESKAHCLIVLYVALDEIVQASIINSYALSSNGIACHCC